MVSVYWNDYRRYYVADLYWGERVVLARGSLAECVAAALREYNRGALGASVRIHVKNEDAGDPCLMNPLIKAWTEEAEQAELSKWQDWRYSEVNQALRLGTTGFLINTYTLGEYQAVTSPSLCRWFKVEGNGYEWACKVPLHQGLYLVWDGKAKTSTLTEEQAKGVVRALREDGKVRYAPDPKGLNDTFRKMILSRTRT
jgi:hypothetical protein